MEPRIIGPDEGRRVSLYEVAFRYGVESSHTVPGGLEDYFEELGPVLSRKGDEATADYYALAARYGITIENDWVADLEDRYGVKL